MIFSISFFLNHSLLAISDNIEFGGPCPLSAVFLLLHGVLGHFKSICHAFVTFGNLYSSFNPILYIIINFPYPYILRIQTQYCISYQKVFVDHSRSIGDFHVHPRIVLISNGRPTDIDADCSPMTGSSEVSAKIVLLIIRKIKIKTKYTQKGKHHDHCLGSVFRKYT